MKRGMKFAFSIMAGCVLFFAPGQARGAEQSVEHTIRSGDNLHLIAGYYYRDPRQWKRIWSANRKTIAAPSRILPGRTLRIEGSAGLGWEIPYEDFRSRVRGK
jgi:nucleoid-associated protein YgaU